jgi:A/G-specific adenine glycosylase
MICKNKDPVCQSCIFQDICKAWEVGEPEGFPMKNNKTVVKKILMFSGILADDESILIAKKKNGIYREMWQFPSVSIKSSTKENLIKKKFHEEFGIKIKSMKLIGSFNHLLSHRNICVKVYTLSVRKTIVKSKKFKWIKAKTLNLLPLPNLDKKVFKIFHNYKDGNE